MKASKYHSWWTHLGATRCNRVAAFLEFVREGGGAVGLIALCLLNGGISSAADATEPGVFPRATRATSLLVLPATSLRTPAEQTLAATLQGLVARTERKQIYLVSGGGYRLWHHELQASDG